MLAEAVGFERFELETGHAGRTERSEGMAGWTGLEPAASGVTGRRSNQLNYHPKKSLGLLSETEWAVQGSNLRQPACKAGALPLS